MRCAASSGSEREKGGPYNFFLDRKEVVHASAVSTSPPARTGLMNLRPDDDVGLVPQHFHVRVVEHVDGHALAVRISIDPLASYFFS